MRRLHLFEIEDQLWCPKSIRDAVTDYLQFSINFANPYAPIVAHLRRVLEKLSCHRIIDLCSGGGGPWLRLQQELEAEKYSVTICLTDRFPNTSAFQRVRAASQGKIAFHPEPVDATNVPAEFFGFRTLFTSFHHFRPADARAILHDAVRNRQGIGIFETTQRHLLAIFVILLSPIFVLISTPFIRPFRWSRLLFTYLLPFVPFVVTFDGIVSCMRTYTLSELRLLTEGLSEKGYRWEMGQERGARSPIPITYLIGYPADEK